MEVGGFDLDRGVETTLIQATSTSRNDFRGGGVPGEAFKELGEGVGTMRPKG